MSDMGLGYAEGDFEAISEDEYDDLMLEQEMEDMLDAEVVELSDDDFDDEAVEGEIEEGEVNVAALGIGQAGTRGRT